MVSYKKNPHIINEHEFLIKEYKNNRGDPFVHPKWTVWGSWEYYPPHLPTMENHMQKNMEHETGADLLGSLGLPE